MRHLLAFVLCAAGLLACPPPAPPGPVPPDASDASALGESAPAPPGSPACAAACATMGAWCSEGRDPYCASTMTRVEADRLIVPRVCPNTSFGVPGVGCTMTCAWCAKATSGAEVTAFCASSCSP